MMKHLELTLPSVAENLALDEALLEQVESSGNVLRLWESPQTAVIVGRASRLVEEVDLDDCQSLGVPVLRRCSGGAAVVIGPGCLLYSVVLRIADHPELAIVDNAHRFVLERLRLALVALGLSIDVSGTSDLTWNGRKFSGNSLRCKREGVLYHGTVLYAAEIPLIARCLRMPPRQPAYRGQRGHGDFLVNLPVQAAELRRSLRTVWQCDAPLLDWPAGATQRLASERYGCDPWNRAR